MFLLPLTRLLPLSSGRFGVLTVRASHKHAFTPFGTWTHTGWHMGAHHRGSQHHNPLGEYSAFPRIV